MEEADGLAQLVAELDPDPRMVGIVVEPLGPDEGVEVGVEPARVVGHRGRTLAAPRLSFRDPVAVSLHRVAPAA